MRKVLPSSARGFSLVEVVIAVFVAAVILTASALALSQSAERNDVARVLDESARVVSQVRVDLASAPFEKLVAGEWQPSFPCDDDPTAGCYQTGSRIWRAEFSPDVPGSGVMTSLEVPVEVTVSADDTEHSRSFTVTVAASEPLSDPRAATVVAYHPESTPNLVLLSADNSQIGSTIRQPGRTVFRYDGNCSGCRIGLEGFEGGEWFQTAQFALLDPEALDDISVGRGGVTHVRVEAVRRHTYHLQLSARPDDSTNLRSLPSSALGSICVWVSTPTGVFSACNDNPATPNRIDISSFPTPSGYRTPLPVGQSVSVSVDHPDRICPHLEALRGHTVDGWVKRAVCPSWTWGYPSMVGPVGGELSEIGESFVITPPDRDHSWELVWAGAHARPATGYAGEASWARPREAPGCSFDGTCRPLGTDSPPPEAELCPGQHCLSAANVPPLPIAPEAAGQGYAVDVEAGIDVAFTVGAYDPDGDPVTVKVVSLPEVGKMYLAGTDTQLTEGQVLYDGGASRAEIPVVYRTSKNDKGRPRFVFSIADPRTQEPIEVEVVLDITPGPAEVVCPGVEVAQGAGTVQGVCTVYDGQGLPLGNVPVSFSTDDPDITVLTPQATSNSQGQVSVRVNMGAAPVGPHRVVANAQGTIGTFDLEVVPIVDAIQITPVTVAQGGSTSAVASAVDRAGDPMAGVVIHASTDAPATITPTCTTGVDGTCQISVSVTLTAPAATYSIDVVSGDLSASAPLEVVRTVGDVMVPAAVSLSQTEPTSFEVTVTDGAGEPYAGIVGQVIVPSALQGTSTFTTDASGKATLTYTASPNTPAQTTELTIQVEHLTRLVTVDILRSAASHTAPAAITTPADDQTQLDVYVFDAAGIPLSGVSVTASTSLQELTVGPSNDADPKTDVVTSDDDGRARFVLTATDRIWVGTFEDAITVTVPGSGTSSVDVVVPNEVFHVIPVEWVRALQGETTEHRFAALNHLLEPVPNTTVDFAHDFPGTITPASSAITDSEGEFTLTASTPSDTPAGPFPLEFFFPRGSSFSGLEVGPVPSHLEVDPNPYPLTPGVLDIITATLVDRAGDPLYATIVEVDAGALAHEPFFREGVTGYWPLDDVSGPDLAARIGDDPASAPPATLFGSSGAWGSGRGTAITLPSNTSITLPHSVEEFAEAPATVMFWAKPTSPGELLSFGPQLSVVIDNTAGDVTVVSGEEIYEFEELIELGVWHQVVLAWSGSGSATLYLDGGSVGNFEVPAEAMDHTAPISVGGAGGSYDEIVLYDFDVEPGEAEAMHLTVADEGGRLFVAASPDGAHRLPLYADEPTTTTVTLAVGSHVFSFDVTPPPDDPPEEPPAEDE